MVTKIKELLKRYWLFVVFLTIFLIIVLPPFYFKKEITAFEIRYYVILFLVLVTITCFGIMRLYNAVVANTRYVIFLRNSMQTLMSEFRKLRDSVDKNTKEVRSSSERIAKTKPKI